MTHTDLSAEEPSERAATGPRFQWRLEAEVKAPGGATMKAKGEVQAPSGGILESAVAVFFLLFAGVALAVAAVVVLAATGMAAWLVVLTAAAVLAATVALTIFVISRKGLTKG